MAYYAYKTVRDQLPEWIIEAQGENYDGDANYDGHQWYAAADYITFLEEKLIGALGYIPKPTDQDKSSIQLISP